MSSHPGGVEPTAYHTRQERATGTLTKQTDLLSVRRRHVYRIGTSVRLTTVRSAKLECTRSTPGKAVRYWLWMRS